MISVNISTEVAWQDIVSKGGGVFDLSKRLPDVVHRLRCGAAPLFDGDIVFGPAAWSMVSSLAARHGDSVVHFLTVEPTEQYFLKSTGEYGGFTAPVDFGRDTYSENLLGSTTEVAVGKIAYAADVVALFGDSRRWGIWSERNVAGLIAVDDPTGLAEWEIEHGPFLSVDDALDGFLAVNLGAGPQAESFASHLRRNYGVFGAGP